MNLHDGIVPSTEINQIVKLKDDFELLDLMLTDSSNQSPLYRPGPYWISTSKNAASEIKRHGIADFRGSTNLIGLSYSDCMHFDVRNTYNRGWKRLAQWPTKLYPLSKIYRSQVRWTEAYANESICHVQEILNTKETTSNLLKKYVVPYSLLGKCLKKAKIEGQEYSTHYLNLLEQHDNIASRINFQGAFSIFEIGGGFGANVHLLLENYKNLRKVLYLDIPPNLYVGTQYLKAFYGTAVVDYRDSRQLDKIEFSADSKLEILCIAPWQIERFQSAVDILLNAHSFVEMPNYVAQNYADKFNDLPGSVNSEIALTSYDGFDSNTTFHPSELPKLFNDRKFDCFEMDTLINSSRKNLYFVSNGN